MEISGSQHTSFSIRSADGSKTSTGTGAAFLNTTGNIATQFKLPDLWSVYSAEVLAIRQALISITTITNTNVLIFSDNKSAILNITSTIPTTHLGWLEINCKITIHRLITQQHNKVKLIWIPGHTGITGNEEVDILAKQAAKSQTETRFCLPLSDAVNLIKTTLDPTFSSSRTPWFLRKNSTREEISIINKIQLNVAFTPAYLYKINKRDSPDCICGQIGDINHLILGCRHYEEHRREINMAISQIQLFGPWNVPLLIESHEHQRGILIKRYLAKCKMKI